MKYLFLFSILLIACYQTEKPLTANFIIQSAIDAHGFSTITNKRIEFDFRGRHYSLLREKDKYTYTRSFQDSLGFVEDILVNSTEFTRLIDGNKFDVDSAWSSKYSNSVNSVLYFIQLPLTLTDPAAIKKYMGTTTLKGITYHLIEVRFEEEDGGKDFQDVFLYWFDEKNFSMDYFAYSYITDGGGVRFREAINRSKIKGIVFQDYINYKPKEENTPLEKLADLFEANDLIELSSIENENIEVTEAY